MKCPTCHAPISLFAVRPRICCGACGAELQTNEVLVSAACVIGGALFGFSIHSRFEWWQQMLVLAANIGIWTAIGVPLLRVRQLPRECEKSEPGAGYLTQETDYKCRYAERHK